VFLNSNIKDIMCIRGDSMFKSDIEIARECEMNLIDKVASKLEIDNEYLEMYGKYKAKINLEILDKYNLLES